MSRRVIAIVAAALCVTLSATAAVASATATVGGRAPDFAVRTLDGKPFRLSAQRGKVVVVDFLLPGCGECQLEAGPLDQAARRFASRGVNVLILDEAGASDSILRSYYLDQLRLRSAHVANDTGLRVSRRYGVNAVGTTLIIGRDGRIHWRGSWLGQQKKLLREIAAAVA